MFWNAKFQVVDVVAKLELAKANVGDGPSVPVLPAQGTLMDVLKNNGQHFSRDLVSSCRRRLKAGVAGVYTRLSRICLDPFNIDVDVKLMKMAVQREGCLVSSDFVACCD